MKKRVLPPRTRPREKGQRARRCAGGWQQARDNSNEMCQDSIDNVLIFNTPARRIGNDPDLTTAAAAKLNVYVEAALAPRW